MESENVERRLAAILSADAVGYSRLMAEDEAGTIRTLSAYRHQITGLVDDHRGRVVDAPGDNVLAEFPTALDAVECGVEIQRVIRARNADIRAEHQMQFRVGIHMGDVAAEGGRIYGSGVNIAARLEALAEPGGICISAAVYEQVGDKLDLGYQDLGEQSVKNIPKPVRVYAVKLETAAKSISARPTRGVPLATGLVLFALAAVAAGWWLLAGRGPAPSEIPPAQIRSLAVLPLENLSGDQDQEYFADGMTEALIGDLAKIGSLRVISRTSVMQFKRARQPLPEIARQLGVEGIVEGTVTHAGDRVRVTVQLVDARNDEHLWAERYDRDLTNVLALQADIAKAVARAVALELTPDESERLSERRAVDPAAYQAYLKGRYSWNKRTADGVRMGLEYFEQAIEADPSYAPAYAGLADAHAILASWHGEPPHQAMPRARAAAERALAIDDTLAEAHASLAAVKLWYDWDWQGAEREFLRAMELNPSYANAPFWYSEVLMISGHPDEAMVHIERALRLDPLSIVIATVRGIRLYERREFRRAAENQREVLQRKPEFQVALFSLGSILAVMGEFDEALRPLRRGFELNPDDPSTISTLAAALALAGDRQEASALIDRLETPAGRKVSAQIASVYAALDEPDLAFEWLERAYQERSRLLVYLTVDPIWDRIRDDPRFADLVGRVGLPSG